MLYSNNNNYYIYYKKEEEEDNNIVHIDPTTTTITKNYFSEYKDTTEIIVIHKDVILINNDTFTDMTELKVVIIESDNVAKQESYDNRGDCKYNGTKYMKYLNYKFTYTRGVRHIIIVH